MFNLPDLLKETEKEFDEKWPCLNTNSQMLGIGECKGQVKSFLRSALTRIISEHSKTLLEAVPEKDSLPTKGEVEYYGNLGWNHARQALLDADEKFKGI